MAKAGSRTVARRSPPLSVNAIRTPNTHCHICSGCRRSFFLSRRAGVATGNWRAHVSGVTDFLFGFLSGLRFWCALIFIASVFTGGDSISLGSMAERWTGKELAGLGPSWRVFHGGGHSLTDSDRNRMLSTSTTLRSDLMGCLS